MRDLLIGVDLGTTHLKLGIFDTDGELHAVSVRSTEPDHLPGGHVVVRPEEWWASFRDAMRECVGRVDAAAIRAIGISSQAQTFFLLDAEGACAGEAISWLDNSGDADGLAGEVPLQDCYTHTGLPHPLPALASAKLRNLQSGTWDGARKIVFGDGFIIYRLTGRCAVSRNLAAMSGLYSMKDGAWWAPALKAARVPARVLPDPVEPGQPVAMLRAELCETCGIPIVPVVAGANDQTAAAVGLGLVSPGSAMLGMGTAFVAFQVIDGDAPAPSTLPFRGPYLNGLHWQLAYSDNAGGTMNWARRTLAGGCSWDDFYSQAVQTAGRHDGLHFDPDLTDLESFRLQGQQPELRQQMLRAVVESAACTARRLLDELGVEGAVRAAGGASRNDAWMQMLADATGRPIERLDQPHAGIWGTALMAGRGAGIFPDVLAAAGRTRRAGHIIQPRSHLRGFYDLVYRNHMIYRKSML